MKQFHLVTTPELRLISLLKNLCQIKEALSLQMDALSLRRYLEDKIPDDLIAKFK